MPPFLHSVLDPSTDAFNMSQVRAGWLRLGHHIVHCCGVELAHKTPVVAAEEWPVLVFPIVVASAQLLALEAQLGNVGRVLQETLLYHIHD